MGAERDAVFWPDPAVLGQGQKGSLVCMGLRDAPMAWLQTGSHEAVAVGTSGSLECEPKWVRESEVGMPCCHPKDLHKVTKAVGTIDQGHTHMVAEAGQRGSFPCASPCHLQG